MTTGNAGMAFDPKSLDLMVGHGFGQPLPQVGVLDRLLYRFRQPFSFQRTSQAVMPLRR